ncbi:histidine phosphatase family protein [Bacillus sp. FJAT-29790]|uniref:histidine phosphatase family protein n=1 Tax=Bacillus sp. FJAT-29790 TaxID=1895002 RepID=UPI001C22AD75|nr:histidine phosphatase family protein [Bacillus sp. FJAT-29790]MBU8879907.1 histidine phosphatase family protein [Bacillus sp. FJAT-29790]
MDDTVAIALFRHGLTEDNKRHAYLGWTDSPLCLIEKEKMQANDNEYELFFSSDLNRCLETMEIMFQACNPLILSELRELNFGQWEKKTYGELKHDPEYQKWLGSPFTVKPPEGESFFEFSTRVQAGWEKAIKKIIDSNVRKAAIMTHGGVIRHLLTKYAPEAKDFWEWKIPHGNGYELIWSLEVLREGERCTLLQEVPLTAKLNG